VGKSTVSSTPAAYYEALANSNTQIAQMAQDQSQQQLDWSKQQYADIAPYEKNYLTQASDSAAAQTEQAKSQWGTYQNTYLPLEKQFADKASTWDSPARADQQSGAAQADVASQYEQARKSATSNLESYGIDPSQTRFGALDLGTRISQAAASAGAGTQARTNTEATGLALMGEAINTGRGYSSAVSQAYSGATTAGSSGVTAGLNTSNTYGNLMGTPVQWSGQANQTRSTTASALQGYGNFEIGKTDEDNAASAAPWQTAASLIGAIGSAAKI
jgi:hypothetical protein